MKYGVIFVFILAFILRVIYLDKVPVGFTPDEASFGYDAYSLLVTGKDQWGQHFPLSFQSFGDYKLPVYGYLTIPFVAIFGLNEFAVRLPNAVLSTLAVLITYLFVFELFKKDSSLIALLSAFLLSISPWHIQLSRGAFEANLTVFFMTLGFYSLLKASNKPFWGYVAALSLGVNLFTYHSARLITPLLLIVFLYIYREKYKFKNYYIPSLFFLVFFVTALLSYFSGSGARASTSVIFNPTDNWSGVADERYYSVAVGEPHLLARGFNNKLVYVFTTVSENYLSYFSTNFLFSDGPRETTYGMIPGRGVLYLFELPGLLMFLYIITRNKKRALVFILIWVLLSPLPASIAKGPGGAANRAAVIMPALQIMSAYGLFSLYEVINKKYKEKLTLIFSSVVVISFLFFTEDYFVGQRISGAEGMIYGAKEVILETNKLNIDEVILTRKLSEPHIYVAFYEKYDPFKYQEESKQWKYKELGVNWVDQIPEYNLGKYTFKYIDKIADFRKNALLVGKPNEFDPNTIRVKTISYPNFKEAYWIVNPNK